MRRMSSPRFKNARALAAMSSCNACPVTTEISPTSRAGCKKQISCNALCGTGGSMSCSSMTCGFEGSCNALTARRRLVAPVAGMSLAPQPHPLAVLAAAEVVFVLRSAQPLALTLRLGCPAALRLRAIALTPAIARITAVYLRCNAGT